jgi:lipopolysaccharide export system protein LptA
MKRFQILVLLAGAFGAAGPAAAQLATNSKAPVDLTADTTDVFNDQCLQIWKGNAEALQGDARMRTDLLKIYLAKKPKAGGGSSEACGELARIEAQGSVFYVTTDRRVRGDAAVYEAANDTLTVTGGVVAVQGQNVLRGERMVINTKTGEGHLVGGGSGRNATDRPRGVFYPKDSNNATPAQPAPKR